MLHVYSKSFDNPSPYVHTAKHSCTVGSRAEISLKTNEKMFDNSDGKFFR